MIWIILLSSSVTLDKLLNLSETWFLPPIVVAALQDCWDAERNHECRPARHRGLLPRVPSPLTLTQRSRCTLYCFCCSSANFL